MGQQDRHHNHLFFPHCAHLLDKPNFFCVGLEIVLKDTGLLLKSQISLQKRHNFLCFSGEQVQVLGKCEACMTCTSCCFSLASIQLKKMPKKYTKKICQKNMPFLQANSGIALFPKSNSLLPMILSKATEATTT